MIAEWNLVLAGWMWLWRRQLARELTNRWASTINDVLYLPHDECDDIVAT